MENKVKVETENGNLSIYIPDSRLKEEININGVNYLLVEKNQLENIIHQNIEFKKDIQELKHCIVSVIDVLGLLDKNTGTIKEKIKTGEEGYFGHIIKALKDVMLLMAEAKFSKSGENKLMEKFDFVKRIIPLIEKHGNK